MRAGSTWLIGVSMDNPNSKKKETNIEVCVLFGVSMYIGENINRLTPLFKMSKFATELRTYQPLEHMNRTKRITERTFQMEAITFYAFFLSFLLQNLLLMH